MMNKGSFQKFIVCVSVLILLATAASGRVFLLDFGGIATPEALDANGNHWNNVNAPVVHYLVDTKKEFSSIGVDFKTNYAAGKNGGLENPDKALLGDFATASATSDYFYNTTASNCTFHLTNLDGEGIYRLRFFASRDAQDIRVTTYTVEGGNGIFTVDLQTSGKEISKDGKSAGNDSDIAVLENLKPDEYGQLKVSYGTKSGGFSYIAAMELSIEMPVAGSLGLKQD